MKWLPDEVLDHVRSAVEEPDLAETRYRLRRLLGRGGMGVVYAVHDEALDREVALKVSSLPVAGEEVATRLRREARVIAGLEHPGIVPVHDAGTLPDGRVYYVMKLVRGERLDAWTERTPALTRKLRMFQRICEAVAFAHAHGVIHRDLKPENVMVGEFGEALVMDWGIARTGDALVVIDAPVASPIDAARGADEASEGDDETADTLPAREATRAGTVLGTPGYMSPEQARGQVEALDARSDVHGLGAILYFLLAGRPPFVAAGVEQMLDRSRHGAPDPLPAIPPAVASICLRALAPDPAARYASALELADDVGRYVDGLPVLAHRETLLERTRRLASRHRVLLSLLGAYLLLRVLLALFS